MLAFPRRRAKLVASSLPPPPIAISIPLHSDPAAEMSSSGCGVLQCVAVCCSVSQCGAVCCSVWQCVAVCCYGVQWVAVCCSDVTVRCGDPAVEMSGSGILFRTHTRTHPLISSLSLSIYPGDILFFSLQFYCQQPRWGSLSR